MPTMLKLLQIKPRHLQVRQIILPKSILLMRRFPQLLPKQTPLPRQLLMQQRLQTKPPQRPIHILRSVRLLLLPKRLQQHLMRRLKRQKQRLQHQMRIAVLPLPMPESLRMRLRSLPMMLLLPPSRQDRRKISIQAIH
ncbi:hypothetical protein AUQ39_14320 [Lacticaseibacillus casei]|nr:hypothetical protein AUQ39_14320 [Lacticaseibacillus casei]